MQEANGHFYRSLSCLLEFDGNGLREGVAEVSRLARRTCSPWVASNAALARAGLAYVQGRFVDVECAVDEMMTTAGTDLSFAACRASLLSLVSYERGHLAESAAILSEFCELHDIPAEARSLLTFATARADLEEARHLVDVALLLGLDQLAALEKYWSPLGAQLAECCVRLDDRAGAALLLEHLRPLSGLLAAGGAAVGFGAMDRFVGMLAAKCGRFEEAMSSFETALKLEERLGSPVFAAWTRYWYASALLDRDGSGDLDRADHPIDQAGQSALEVGMGTLSSHLTRLGQRLSGHRSAL